jgi:hypothetical protein
MTYLKAKRTLLQPIRTEIFKEQIKLFTEVLSMFTGKGEIELREDLAFDEFFKANCCMLFDAYASLFFDIKFDQEKRPYSKKLCPVSILHQDAVELADNYVEGDNRVPEKPGANTRAAIWSNHKHLEICLPQKHLNAMKRIKAIKDSPLLPKKCLELIEDYEKTINDNLLLLRDILNEVASEFPSKYPNFSVMKKASTNWVTNKYVDKFSHLEPKAKAITTYIRKYYLTDELLQ